MATPTNPPRPLAELLTELEAAVRAGDRARAYAASNRRSCSAWPARRLTAPAWNAASAPDGGTGSARRRSSRHQPGPVQPRTRQPDRPTPNGVVYPMWFGTNRKPAAQGDGFTGERHDRITRGRVEVYVPEAHRFGETGTGFWQTSAAFRPRATTACGSSTWRGRSATPSSRTSTRAMQAARDSGEQPHALFFLHGFNVTFADAAIRAAQIGYDLKVPGATAFFSWPSRGSVAAYPVDEASIEASERAITDFLVDFTGALRGGEGARHRAQHGQSRPAARRWQRIAAQAQTLGQVKFGQVFLAAPDVDRDLFLDLARLYPEHAERTTLYASNGDLPVHLSAKLHDAPRSGYFMPYTVAPGIDNGGRAGLRHRSAGPLLLRPGGGVAV